jgi:hypothetical protein
MTTSARRLAVAGALVAGLAACAGRGPGDGGAEGPVRRSVEEVQEAYTPEWMGLPGVAGTAVGLCDDRACIKVYVDGSLEVLRERIPSEVEGYPVVLEGTGPIRARGRGSG